MLSVKSFLSSCCGAWLTCCVLALCCARVAAQGADVVLLLDAHSSEHAGLISALQIELGETYQVSVAAEPVPASLPERIARATELVESKRALATVWIEPGANAPARRSALLYVVGRRAGRALLEVVDAPDTRGLDLERMLSIKLAELLAELRGALVHPLNPEPTPQPSAAGPSEPEPRQRVDLMLQAGPRFQLGLDAGWSRVGLGVGLAAELAFGRARLAFGLGAEGYPSLTQQTSGGEVRLRELAPGVFVGASWLTPELSLGLQAGPVLSLMRVRGRTPLGAASSDSFHELGLALQLSAERAVSAAFTLGARAALQVSGQRLRFDVNEQTVLDRGWLRLTLGIDVTFRTNLSGAP